MLTSGKTQRQIASETGVGLSTIQKWLHEQRKAKGALSTSANCKFHVVQLFTKAVDDVRKLEADRQSFQITPIGPYSKALRKNARKTRKMLFLSSLNRALLPPKPTASKNSYAGFAGPNQGRLPSGAFPTFSSVQPSILLIVHFWSQ
jgi:transcriptional regulator with XRE-family HTH domain